MLLTTHYMYEADELCQRIAVIAGGKFVATGTPAELKARVLDRTVIEIETFGIDEPVLERLRAVAGVVAVDNGDARPVRDRARPVGVGAELVQVLLRELDGAQLGKVIAREPTLEDAYVELVQPS